MIGTSKTFSLALIAAAVMSVTAASVAQAFQYHAETPQAAVLTGHQIGQLVSTLTHNLATTKCTQATFEGTVEGGSPQITVQEFTLTPTISGCQMLGTSAAVKFNGCKFTITSQLEAPSQTAISDLVGCTVGKQVEIQTAVCTVTIPEQSQVSHAVGTNSETNPKDITVKLTLRSITYELHGAGCGGTQTVMTHGGDLDGEITLNAYKDLGTAQVTAHSHQYSKHNHDSVAVGLFGT